MYFLITTEESIDKMIDHKWLKWIYYLTYIGNDHKFQKKR